MYQKKNRLSLGRKPFNGKCPSVGVGLAVRRRRTQSPFATDLYDCGLMGVSGGLVEGQWRAEGTPTMPQSLYTWAFPAILVEGGGLFA